MRSLLTRETSMALNKAWITKRIDPCNCGCQGQDSQHLKNYFRVLHDEREETGRCKVRAFDRTEDYDRVAFASAPWSKERVKVVRVVLPSELKPGTSFPLGWFFAEER